MHVTNINKPKNQCGHSTCIIIILIGSEAQSFIVMASYTTIPGLDTANPMTFFTQFLAVSVKLKGHFCPCAVVRER